MIIFHTLLIDPERGIVRSSVCHSLSNAKATLAACMVDYPNAKEFLETVDITNVVDWFNKTQEYATIACNFYDTDEEAHVEFNASDERGNKPEMTVGEAIALAEDDDDDVLVNMEVAGHA